MPPFFPLESRTYFTSVHYRRRWVPPAGKIARKLNCGAEGYIEVSVL